MGNGQLDELVLYMTLIQAILFMTGFKVELFKAIVTLNVIRGQLDLQT